MLRYMMTTFEATVPLGHRGRGTEESIENNDRQALVVHAVYKSRMRHQHDAGVERVKSA